MAFSQHSIKKMLPKLGTVLLRTHLQLHRLKNTFFGFANAQVLDAYTINSSSCCHSINFTEMSHDLAG